MKNSASRELSNPKKRRRITEKNLLELPLEAIFAILEKLSLNGYKNIIQLNSTMLEFFQDDFLWRKMTTKLIPPQWKKILTLKRKD